MIQFHSTMRKMILISLLFVSMFTASVQDYPPDPQYDITRPLMRSLYELIEQIDKYNSCAEWYTQIPVYDTYSYNYSSKNISFSTFVSNDGKYPFPQLLSIHCGENKATVEFYDSTTTTRTIMTKGKIRFTSSSCEVSFSLSFGNVEASYEISHSKGSKVKNIITFTFHRGYVNFTVLDEVGESCANISEEQRQSMENDSIQAMKIVLSRKYFLDKARSIFHSTCNTFWKPNKYFNENKENNYVHFRSDPTKTTFPWLSNYDELIIKSSDNFRSIDINPIYCLSKSYLINFTNINISRASVSTTLNIFTCNLVHLWLMIDKKKYPEECTTSEIDVQAKIESNNDERSQCQISSGIQTRMYKIIREEVIQATSKRTQYNITGSFINAIHGIKHSFEEKTFRNVFNTPRKITFQNSSAEKITFDNIALEVHPDFKNITCSLSNNAEIGRLSYTKITTQVEFSYRKDDIKVKIDANVHIKNATSVIAKRKISSMKNNGKVGIIEDNFEDSADITIMIASEYYHLLQKERVAIAKRILNDFSISLRNQIVDAASLTFHPVLNACENSPNNPTEYDSNYRDNQQLFYAFFTDQWSNSTISSFKEEVDIVIHGWWNFKLINAHTVKYNIVIENLRIENVTGSVQKHDHSSNKSVLLHYSMDYISLIMNDKDNEIWIETSKFSNESSVLISSKSIRLSNQEATEIADQIYSSVASYIDQSIYPDNSIQRKKNRINVAMKNILIEEHSPYNISTELANNIAQRLCQLHRASGYNVWNISIDDLEISSTEQRQIDVSNHTYKILRTAFYLNYNGKDNFIRNEICTNTTRSEITHNWPLLRNIGMAVTSIDNESRTNDLSLQISLKQLDMNFSYHGSSEKSVINHDENNAEVKYLIDNVKFYKENADAALLKNVKQIVTAKLEKFFQNSTTFKTTSLCDNQKDLIIRKGFHSEADLKKYFYSISGTIKFTNEYFSVYNIKLYGVFNYNSLKIERGEYWSEFEFVARNLLAFVTWNYYIGDRSPDTPKTMNFQIKEISMSGSIDGNQGKLSYINDVQIFLSDEENLTTKKYFKKRMKPIISESLTQAISREFESIFNDTAQN